MSQDNISEILIDSNGRLCIKPTTKEFILIYRSATEVHWEKDTFFTHQSPENGHILDWYKHIISVISSEYDCKLTITTDTKWTAIPNDLKNDILDFER